MVAARAKTRRYLTKTRFKIALECPAKLYYYDHPDYPTATDDDPFLEALQNGGFQVGELARLYHPGGILVEETDPAEAVAATRRFMERPRVTLFEPAFEADGLLVRVDVLIKDGSHVTLKEVKSRSFHPTDDTLRTKTGRPRAEWMDLLADVAFQTFVVRRAHPKLSIEPYLTLCDKSAEASVDGLNGLFKVDRSGGGEITVRITEDQISPERLGDPVLLDVPVGPIAEQLIADDGFRRDVERFRDAHLAGEKLPTELGRKCRTCEYRIPDDLRTNGHRSGFRACWKERAGFSDEDFERPHLLDIGDMYYGHVDKALESGTYFMSDVDPELLSDRNRLQVRCETDPDHPEECFDERMFEEMSGWTYPLHMIDFETATAALPFYRGQRPYQLIAFQFSCHDIRADGTVVHRGEWIAPNPDRIPNVAFVRALKAMLEVDDGTILRYSHHENTVLNGIYELLDAGPESRVEDADELKEWIREITEWKVGNDRFSGRRCMVDLCDVVKKYYYHRRMRGSNSIKKVLPAVLSASEVLEELYTEPYVGSNFPESIVWYRRDHDGEVRDPYDLLPKLEGRGDDEVDPVNSGGVAATAFARMQFTDMSDEERTQLTNELLRYCELDTLAMVMLWQHFASLAKSRTV